MYMSGALIAFPGKEELEAEESDELPGRLICLIWNYSPWRVDGRGAIIQNQTNTQGIVVRNPK